MRKIGFTLIGAALLCPAETLTRGERDRAMSELHATRKMFLDSIANLNDAQWNFKPAPERWSIAEVAEHIAVSEDMLFDLVRRKIIESPADEEKKALVKGKDEQVLKLVPERTQKFQAPEFLQPTKRWPSREDLVRHFKESRDRTITYVEQTPDDLRAHFADHPVLKTLDGYQWVLLIAAHTNRHVQQIEEVKADAKYPK